MTETSFAKIVSMVVDTTADVPIEKEAELLPPVTVTVAGTTALDPVEERKTEIPDGGATPDNVIVPVEVLPPITDVGERLIAERVGAVIVSVAGCRTFPMPAFKVTISVFATGFVVTAKVAVFDPAGTTKVVGTCASVEPDDR